MTKEQAKRLKEECQRLRDKLKETFGEEVFLHRTFKIARESDLRYSVVQTSLEVFSRKRVCFERDECAPSDENINIGKHHSEMALMEEMLRLFGGKEWEFLRG